MVLFSCLKSNIFFKESTLKLGDFGLSKKITNDNSTLNSLTQCQCTYLNTAPELYLKEFQNENQENKIDIW